MDCCHVLCDSPMLQLVLAIKIGIIPFDLHPFYSQSKLSIQLLSSVSKVVETGTWSFSESDTHIATWPIHAISELLKQY